jgi:sucrose-6-phosphate hydrolase SacC (GH32 family)
MANDTPVDREWARRSSTARVLALGLGCTVACASSTGCREQRATPPLVTTPPATETIIADFEGGYDDLQVTGTAFGDQPTSAPQPGQPRVSGYQGTGYASSNAAPGDGAVGALSSASFQIQRPFINFLIGGRRDPERVRVDLLVDGAVVRTATGDASDRLWVPHLAWHSWDVRSFLRRDAQIRIVDDNGEEGAYIMVDHIVMSDQEPGKRALREPLLKDADAAVASAARRVADDPLRPRYHLQPAANWMNDPNGPIYYNGYYHLFFQHNPYGDDWGNMHWGHVRSPDLVHWERLPIALWPSLDDNEDHCFSGCAVVDDEGKLRLFYTSIGQRDPEQWAAVSMDEQATQFRKAENNPVLTLAAHGDLVVEEWRDPFVFREGDFWYMVVGGRPRGGPGSIFLYKSADLVNWKFLGVPISGTETNWECPLLFRLDGRWVLIYSPYERVRYITGDLDLAAVKFTAHNQGFVDLGLSESATDGHFYAPNTMQTPDGRQLLFGWVRGFPKGRGWSGALTVPRVLHLTAEGQLVQTVATELEALRKPGFHADELHLASGSRSIDAVKGDALELSVRLNLRGAERAGIRLRRARQNNTGVEIGFDGQRLTVAKQVIKLDSPQQDLDVRVFFDRSVLEIFAGGGTAAITHVLSADPDDVSVELFADEGGAAFTDLSIWPMASIWDQAQAAP